MASLQNLQQHTTYHSNIIMNYSTTKDDDQLIGIDSRNMLCYEDSSSSSSLPTTNTDAYTYTDTNDGCLYHDWLLDGDTQYIPPTTPLPRG